MIRYLCKTYLPYRWMTRSKVFHPSLDRLAELVPAGAASADALASASDEFSRILQNLRIRGVWKWTGQHRLRQMDRLLTDCAVASGWTRLRMLDIGASDGITTLDTVEHLRRIPGMSAHLTIIDQDVRLLAVQRGASTIYFTSSRRPLLVRRGKFALCLEPMEGLEGILFNRLAAALARRYARILEHADLGCARSIPLMNPAVVQCPSIDVCEGNLFGPREEWFGRFDAIRASNVLNLAYYSEARIQEAVGLVHRYLKDGGVFLVSRNWIQSQGEMEAGALWRKQGDRFLRVSELETLPEIAGLVDGFRLPADRVPSPAQPGGRAP